MRCVRRPLEVNAVVDEDGWYHVDGFVLTYDDFAARYVEVESQHGAVLFVIERYMSIGAEDVDIVQHRPMKRLGRQMVPDGPQTLTLTVKLATEDMT
jgi:hypothetical protein